MECINCGSPIFEGDKFCSRCGTRVAEETGIETETHAIIEETGDGTPRRERPEDDNAVLKAEKSEEEKAEKSEKEKRDPAGTEPVYDLENEIKMCEGTIPPCIPEEKPSRSRSRFKGMLKEKNAAFEADRPKKWVSRAIMGGIGVVAVILAANSAKLINSLHRNFSTPEEYYRWVEHKAIQKNAKVLAEYYVNHFVEYLHRYDHRTCTEIHVELGDAGREMMEHAGLEPWFTEGVFTFEFSGRNSITKSILGLEINGEQLFGMDAIMDLNDEAVYLGFPGFTKTYLGVDTEERRFAEGFEYVYGMEPEEHLEYLEFLEILCGECPDRKEVEALADRYLELLLNSIDDVKMRTGKTVRVGSIAQTCTALEISLDKDDIQNMLKEFLEEIQEDSEVEALLFQIFELAEELASDKGDYRDADELYKAFRDKIDMILNDLEFYVTYHNELDMTVYVDDKGQIIGRTIEFPNSREEFSFSYLIPHRGSRTGYRSSITVGGEEMLITGTGREFGKKISGNFTVKYGGNSIVDIDVKNFDLYSLRKGFVKGRFIVTLSSGIGRALNMSSADSDLSKMELFMDISMNRSSEKISMELREGGNLWGVLTITVESDSGKKISVPSTRSTIFVSNDREFEDWWNTVEWDGVLKKMDKAGLPSYAMDTVEEFCEKSADEVLDELLMLMRFLVYDLME